MNHDFGVAGDAGALLVYCSCGWTAGWGNVGDLGRLRTAWLDHRRERLELPKIDSEGDL